MRFRALLLSLIVASLACAPEKKSVPPLPPVTPDAAAEVVEPDFDADNLLNLAYGASVVSRTAELNLEASAAQAIDGVTSSAWASPPGGPQQTLVFSLLAPASVSQLGVTTPDVEGQTPAQARFESSMDGTTWRLAATVDLKAAKQPQLVDVKPFTTQYLRVSFVEKSDYYAYARSIHAIGSEIAPPSPKSPAGCWTINEKRASIVQDGARIAGTIDTVPPTSFEGGTDGRVARFLWTRGPMWGHGVMTLTPDGGALTAVEIHESIHIQHLGGSWFGERCASDTAAPADVGIEAARLVERTERWPLFGLAFDGNDALLDGPSAATLDSLARLVAAQPSQRFRLTSYELRESDPAKNRSRAAERLTSLRAGLSARNVDLSRLDFVTGGSDWKGPALSVAIQRLLASAIVVEAVR